MIKELCQIFESTSDHPLDIFNLFLNRSTYLGYKRVNQLPNCVILDNAVVLAKGTFTVQPYTVFSGLCVLGDNTFIGPHCFIRGPIFLGDNTLIGPYSEIVRSIFLHDTKLYHRNTVLDSIFGCRVQVGGQSGTANRMLDNSDILVQSASGIEKTTSNSYGITADDDVYIGACVITMPGKYIPAGKVINLLGKADYQLATHRVYRK